MTEEWRSVVGFEGLYEVSDRGRLRSARRKGSDGRIIALGSAAKREYIRVSLYRDGIRHAKKVHRLVLESFAGPCPPGAEGCHNDGNRAHNWASNLRWDTRKANCADTRRHGSAAVHERNGCAKLNSTLASKIRELRASGATYQALADQFGVTPSTIWSVASGRTWAPIEAEAQP